MRYINIVEGIFISRPNRFIAEVIISGKHETVHVKNTGRCKELLIKGAKVILQKADNPDRKTQYDLISVYKEGTGWINIDSQVPNKVFHEWLLTDRNDNNIFKDIMKVRPEYTYGDSRFDFYLESDENKYLIEVKGCTLEINGTGYFPDAPTVRGVKHLKELIKASKEGYICFLVFVIAIPGIRKVLPNIMTHPEFGKALSDAYNNGVGIIYLSCDVRPDEITGICAECMTGDEK